MEKNNGKIAIAIVAMFVVALSIVGFTYAYFVANVQGNDTVNVDVTAGILEVAYANNTGNTVQAYNIVPGWMSDGLHYFDSTKFETDAEGNATYTAQMATSEETIPEGVDVNDGITKPYNFTVSGSSRNTGDAEYVIILNSISKTNVAELDKANFKYALCKDECPVWSNATETEGVVKTFNGTEFDTLVNNDAVISSGSLYQATDSTEDDTTADKKVLVISGVETASKTATNSYQLMLYYLETSAEQASKGATISADIEIVGVQKVGDNYVDGNGTIIPVTIQ